APLHPAGSLDQQEDLADARGAQHRRSLVGGQHGASLGIPQADRPARGDRELWQRDHAAQCAATARCGPPWSAVCPAPATRTVGVVNEHTPPPPDEKDWTWVVERACPECRFDAVRISSGDLADGVVRLTAPWPDVLARSDVRSRPAPPTWSPPA